MGRKVVNHKNVAHKKAVLSAKNAAKKAGKG